MDSKLFREFNDLVKFLQAIWSFIDSQLPVLNLLEPSARLWDLDNI